MNLKIIAVLYIFLASEATLVVSLAGNHHNLTDLDQKGMLRDQAILELDSSLNKSNNMCQLCTKEMVDNCFPLGDYHDFHVDKSLLFFLYEFLLFISRLLWWEKIKIANVC